MLTLWHLNRQIHAKNFLQEIALTLLPGALIRVTGSSGSGKTTLLETIAGKQPCPQGSILFDNQETRGNKLFLGDTLYLAESHDDLVLRWTVSKQLRYWAKQRGEQELITPAVNFFRLQPWLDVPLRELSVGWRQRVRLTKLIVQPAALWLLDRPMQCLDEEGCNMAETLIASRCQQSGIVLFTHDGETLLNPHGVVDLP